MYYHITQISIFSQDILMNFVYFNTIIADLTIFYKNKNSQQLCKLFLEEKYYELKNDTESV